MSQSNAPIVAQHTSCQVENELQNQVFRGIPRLSRYNACVGDNGYPNIYYYAEGFAKAVFSLIDNVIMNDLSSLDTSIYPICFNVRHSVELYLKALWEQLSKIADFKNVRLQQPSVNNREYDILKLHDIGIIWSGVKSNAAILDRRFRPILDTLDFLIMCIHQVDPTGQTFRYSYDMETKVKHLVPVAVINIINLREQFTKIKSSLEELKTLSLYMCYEYSMGTFTHNLSRYDIGNIAQRLPIRERWQDDELWRVRDDVIAEYGISKKEFSYALTKIEELHDFSFFIGVEKEPLGLSEKDIFKFIDIWSVRNDINEWRESLISALDESKQLDDGIELNFSDGGAIFDSMMADLDKNREAFGKFSGFATPDIIAGAIALYEFRGCSFSEEYMGIYNERFEYFMDCYTEGGERWMTAMKNAWSEYFESSYFVQRIIISLRMLNMKSSALALERYCMVEGLIPQTN
ncbi:hypothetical protein [Aeromonas dhakensis]|uniref:hypothetical protein n=1 Tax=Aeromonas dhakensis TaxID=196024 RepID=UPI0039872FBB